MRPMERLIECSNACEGSGRFLGEDGTGVMVECNIPLGVISLKTLSTLSTLSTLRGLGGLEWHRDYQCPSAFAPT